MSASELAEIHDAVPEDEFDRILAQTIAQLEAVEHGEDDRRGEDDDSGDDAVIVQGDCSIGTIMLEQDVLKPIPDNVIANDNDWPEYHLHGVTIRETGQDELTSLFAANAVVSVVVTGYLTEVDERVSDQLVDPNVPGTIGTFIEVQDVRFYSYGALVDGQIAIWAAGKAGWYEIHPAAEYQAIYDQMVKSVELLHFLQDTYGRRTKRAGKMVSAPVQTTFEEYARAHPEDCPNPRAATELFHQHRDFLIAQMLKRDQAISWGNTPFYLHLVALYRADFARIRAQHRLPDANRSERAGVDDNAVADAPASVPATQEQDQGGVAVSEVPYVEATTRFARGLLEILREIYRCGRLPPCQLGLDAFAGALYRNYDVQSLRHARNVLEECAPELVRLMKETERTPFDWTLLSVYDHLCDVVRENTWLKRFLWEELRPRDTPLPETSIMPTPNFTPPVVVLDDDEEEEASIPPSKRRMTVRPTSFQPYNEANDDEQDELVEYQDLVSGGATASSRKRNHDAMKGDDEDDDDDDDSIKPKRSTRRRSRPRHTTARNDNDDDDDDESVNLIGSTRRRRHQVDTESYHNDDGDEYGEPVESTRSTRPRLHATDTEPHDNNDDDDDDESVKPTTRRRRQAYATSGTGPRAPKRRRTTRALTPKPKRFRYPSTSTSSRQTVSTTTSTFAEDDESWKPIWPRHAVIEEELPQHRGGAGSNKYRWVCPMDGCLHTVWNPETTNSQVWIREHMQDHVQELLPTMEAVSVVDGDEEGDDDEVEEDGQGEGEELEGEADGESDEGEAVEEEPSLYHEEEESDEDDVHRWD